MRYFLVFLFALCTCTPQSAFSSPHPSDVTIQDSTHRIAEKFAHNGLGFYAQQNAPEAIDYFSRALLLDPANQLARDTMRAIASGADLSAQDKAQLFLLEYLLEFVQHLRSNVHDLTAKRNQLADELVREEGASSVLRERLAAIEARFPIQENSWRLNDRSLSPLEALIASLTLEKERLTQEFFCRQKQYAWLKEIRTLPHDKTVATVEPQTQEFIAAPIVVRSAIPWKELDEFREELSQVRQQLTNLKTDVDDKNKKVAELTKEIIDFSLKLAEKEMTLSEQVRALGSLRETHTDLQSRLNLGQKIIQEKSLHIQSLQDSLASLQAQTASREKEFTHLLADKDKALTEWENVLEIYRAKLKEATQKIETSNRNMAALQQELTLAYTKIFEKETALEKTKHRLAVSENRSNRTAPAASQFLP